MLRHGMIRSQLVNTRGEWIYGVLIAPRVYVRTVEIIFQIYIILSSS